MLISHNTRTHFFVAKEKKKKSFACHSLEKTKTSLIGLFLRNKKTLFVRQKISLLSALKNKKKKNNNNDNNKTNDRHDLRDLFALFARGAFSFAR